MQCTKLLSVGIDVGTTTTQVIFARLTLEDTAGYFAVPHVSIVDREVVYRGPVEFTPLRSAWELDAQGIRALVEKAYRQAGFRPSQVETGAVIITGEAARKQNAAALLQALSDYAGDFVVSTAGPDLESTLAGKGSGAQSYSEKTGAAVVNLDIGGGTTNLVLFDAGTVCARGCLDLGGRLIRLDGEGRIASVSPSAARIAAALGIDLAVGEPARVERLRPVCARMARLLEQELGLCPREALLDAVLTPQSTPFRPPRPIQAICFSGGVADCIAGEAGNWFRYGDIGPLFAAEIRSSALTTAFQAVAPRETIRATVIGAGSCAASVTGSTISQQDGVLPLKNVPVLKLSQAEQERCYGGDARALEEKMRWFLEQSDSGLLLLAMRGRQSPSYGEVEKLADCITWAVDRCLAPGLPVLVALESDTAKALGQCLRRRQDGRAVVCIDGILTGENDYIDIGQPVFGGVAIPVVVKSLAVGAADGGAV